jgi:hypothetical protein
MREGGPGLNQKQDKIDPEKFIELWKCGWNDVALGEYFGVTKSNARHYRNRLGLPSKQSIGRGKKNVRSRNRFLI